MLRTFTKDKMITILMDRPATIRSLQKPNDPKFIARCLRSNSRVTEFMDHSWLSLDVLKEYVILDTEARYPSSSQLTHFPVNIRKELPLDLLKELCRAHVHAVLLFPQAPYELYLDLIKDGNHQELNKIPPQHRTDELLAALLAKHPYNNIIPEESFNDNVVDLCLKSNPRCINNIPDKFITHDRLKKVLAKTAVSLNKSLPFEAWDQDLAMAATADGENIEYIPEVYITKDMCLAVVKKACCELKKIPARFKDEDVVLTAMAAGDLHLWPEAIPAQYRKSSSLLKLAAKDNESGTDVCYGIRNIQQFEDIDPKDWVKILKVCPRALKHIRKEIQTDDMINAYFEGASLDLIDKLHQYINLARIKKEHAPYLIGSTVKLFQDIVARKMVKKPRKDIKQEVQTIQKQVEDDIKQVLTDADIATLDLTDSEYLDITKKFGQ